MSQALTDEDWKRAADSAYREANNEASFYGLNVFVEVFDDGCRRYEARGTPPPEGAEEAALRARIADLEKEQEGLLRRVERLEAVLKAGRDNVVYVRTRADLEAWRAQAEIALYGKEVGRDHG